MKWLRDTDHLHSGNSVEPLRLLARRVSRVIALLLFDGLAVLVLCLLLQAQRGIAAFWPTGLAGRVRARRSCHLNNLGRAVAVAHLCDHGERRTGFAGSRVTTRRSSC